MKRQNRVSQLTLELYHRGLATRKERKQVEKALCSDIEVRSRYKALEDSELEIHKFLSQELRRLNIPELPLVSQSSKTAWGILAAAVLLCLFIPAFFYLKGKTTNVQFATAINTDTKNETTEHIPPIKELTQTSGDRENNHLKNDSVIASVQGTETLKSAETEQRELLEETLYDEKDNIHPAIIRPDNYQPVESQSGGVFIAALPQPDTGVVLRGKSLDIEPPNDTAVPEERPNINIPPGLTFIFENMFANRGLSYVIIPAEIASIGKNAFAGNPLVSVTIGANVVLSDDAIPGNFAVAYNNYGKTAGTYARSDTNSSIWAKK